jgi:hypothetical protein
MKKILRSTATAAALVGLSCTEPTAPLPELGSLDLGSLQVTLPAIGRTIDFPLEAKDKTGIDMEVPAGIVWTSSDLTTVTVDQTGKARAIKDGDATVTARLGDVSVSAVVQVRAAIELTLFISAMANPDTDKASDTTAVRVTMTDP